MMAKILTGVQSTGTPHLGNLLGAIIPAIQLSNDPKNESFLFIADLHSITQIKNGALLRTNTYSTAAAWLACGLDVNKVVLPAVGRATNSTVLVFELFFLFND
jgi:tryptophanyl-tRNA synthetase